MRKWQTCLLVSIPNRMYTRFAIEVSWHRQPVYVNASETYETGILGGLTRHFLIAIE
jgi:hypothetical protein